MKKIKYLLMALFIMFLGFTNVYAAETDFSNATLTVEGLTDESHTTAYISVSNVVLDSEIDYKAVFTKTANVVNSFTNAPDLSPSIYTENGTIKISSYTSAAERYGDVYVTFYEKEKTTGNYTKVSNPILVKRPEELKITKRIHTGLYEDSSILIFNSINNLATTKTANYKIGKVTDNNIFKNVKNGNYSGLESLLTYAKNDNNAVKTGAVELKSTAPSLYAQNDLQDGSYYYVYFDLDTENGKYYPVEDVNLYQAKTTSNGKIWLYDYLSSEFEWNIDEDSSLTEWEKYVELFKNNKYTTEYKSTVESAGGTLTIQHDESTLKLILNDSTGTFTTVFNHNNGIVSYAAKNGIGASELMFDNIWISVAIDTLCNKFGYNTEEVLTYLENSNGLTIGKDGIEFTLMDVSSSESGSYGDVSISGSGFETLKFDIIKGLKNYSNNSTNNTVPENPKTGINICYTFLGLVLAGGIVIYIYSRKHNKFPQV
ncbi:MAG: hypothetical protein E7166_05370 [Firmicutes bacterium]|nr:hypothetical protein [Bacillota bacterium]